MSSGPIRNGKIRRHRPIVSIGDDKSFDLQQVKLQSGQNRVSNKLRNRTLLTFLCGYAYCEE